MAGEELTSKRSSSSKQELILFRLDSMDKQLAELKTLLAQTASQEQRIVNLERASAVHEQEKEKLIELQRDNDYIKEELKAIKDTKKQSNDKWWQILLMILSPLASALMVWLISGGLK